MKLDPAILADPRIFQLNRLAPHARFMFRFGNGESCTRSLNGTWEFRFAERPDRPFGEWGSVQVPGHIQMQGGPKHLYGKPHYVNTQYPWDGHEALIPGEMPKNYNPVGEYRREFALPETWKNCFIRFEGVDSALALWCNDQFVGYSESSFDTAEFDLSAVVHPGINVLTAQVFRFCTGSWLEDQDFWRMSGIFRPVTLFTKPATHVEDIRMETTFGPDYAWADVSFFCKMSGSMDGNVGLSFAGVLDEVPLEPEIELRAHVEHPLLWSAERPNLYDAAFVVHGADDEMVEIAGFKAGLREFCLRDGVMQLNGKRIVFKGVNRHEWSAEHGRAVTREETEWDILNLKRHNVNAVRTCHYPDQSYFYDLCDRYGLYVIDETNLETHGTWQRPCAGIDEYTLPGDRPEYRDAVLARGAAMLERDKNHPCVLLWSCGNESAGGKTLFELSEYFRRTDPSRLVHYESIFHDRTYNATSDVESQMYTPATEVRRFLEQHRDKPFLLCEYGHSMGNSCGELEDYTEMAYEEPLYQGGFLWEYMDHSMFTTLDDGRRGLVYGGDFGRRPNDGEFCVDGLVTGDRRNSPKMQAVKGAYQSFALDVTAEGVHIENRNLFTDLSEYELIFTLAENGAVLENRTMQLSLAPGESTTITPLPFARPSRPGFYTMTALVRQKEDTPWTHRGDVIAVGQAIFSQQQPIGPDPEGEVRLVEGGYNFGVRGEGFEYLISRTTGRLVSMNLRGRELLTEPAELTFWRAATDNDRGSGTAYEMAPWMLAGHYAKGETVTAVQLPHAVEVKAAYRLATAEHQAVESVWRFTADGRCTVRLTWQGERTEVPEFGLLLPLDARYQEVEYFGRGPEECMPDRRCGAVLGRWRYKVKDNADLNVRPQEYGARVDVRRVKLSGVEMPALRLRCTPQDGGWAGGFVFSACPWTPQELECANHVWQLPPSTRTVVRCTLSQRGAGGDDSWSQNGAPHEEYRFAVAKGSTFAFSFGL